MSHENINAAGLLYSLLLCYSPSSEEGYAAATLVEFMRRAGFDTRFDQIGNIIGSIGTGPREIVLLGHLDTVVGYLTPNFDGERLYGRGAVDAKGPLACFTSAASLVGRRQGWKITVIGAVGEEADSRGAKHLCETYPAPDLVVIGEPSGWDSVTLGYKGGVWGEYHVQCANGHIAGNKVNACGSAFAFWNRVLAAANNYNQAYQRVFDQISPMLVAMASDENGYAQTARLKFNIRIPTGVSPLELKEMLESFAEDGKVRLDECIHAYKSEKNNVLSRHLIAAIRKHGGRPGYKLKTGTSDMNVVAPVWNKPVVAYGPGDSNLDHTPDEHISLPEYEASIHVLADALRTITANSDS